jgi:hypothetical protein
MQSAATSQATAAAIGLQDVGATVAERRDRDAVLEECDVGDDARTVDGVLPAPSGLKMARRPGKQTAYWERR